MLKTFTSLLLRCTPHRNNLSRLLCVSCAALLTSAALTGCGSTAEEAAPCDVIDDLSTVVSKPLSVLNDKHIAYATSYLFESDGLTGDWIIVQACHRLFGEQPAYEFYAAPPEEVSEEELRHIKATGKTTLVDLDC